jgi:hypothetical protein
MAHYSYWVKRYSKKSRRQVSLTVIGMVAVFIGSVVALQESGSERERNVRVQSEFTGRPAIQRSALIKQQDEYIRNACLDGKDACDKAKRKSNRSTANSSERVAHETDKTPTPDIRNFDHARSECQRFESVWIDWA